MPSTENCRQDLLPERGLRSWWWLAAAAHTVAADIRDYETSKARSLGSFLRGVTDIEVRRPVFIVGSPRSGTTFLGSAAGKLPEMS